MKKILFILCFWCAIACGAEDLVILGGGPAGLTAGLFAAQANIKPLIIEGSQEDGQIASVSRIENYPGFPEGISGQELTARIRQQAEAFGSQFIQGMAIEVDLLQHPFKIILEDQTEIYCTTLIIATGSNAKKLGLQKESTLEGVSTSALLDGPKFNNRHVAVVGGGDAALEQALLIADHAAQVTLVHKEGQIQGVAYLKERVLSHEKIHCLFNSEVIALEGEEGVTGLILKNNKTEEVSSFACEGIIISNGRKPNTELFKDQLKLNARGSIVTQADSTATNIPGVFAAGDITHTAYRKSITAAASGCMAAMDAANFLKNIKK